MRLSRRLCNLQLFYSPKLSSLILLIFEPIHWGCYQCCITNAQQVHNAINSAKVKLFFTLYDANELNGFFCVVQREERKNSHKQKKFTPFWKKYTFSPRAHGVVLCEIFIKKHLLCMIKRGKMFRRVEKFPWRCIVVCVVNMMIIFNHDCISLSL